MAVYVVHPVSDDISRALKFGELRYINKRYVYGDELEQVRHTPQAGVLDFDPTIRIPESVTYHYNWTVPFEMQRKLVDAARVFNAETDYLLIAGDHLQLLVMTAALARVYHRGFMVLRYDRKISDYIPVRVYPHLVPTIQPVLSSSNIGETEHAESSHAQEATRLNRQSAEPRSTEWVKQTYEGKRSSD